MRVNDKLILGSFAFIITSCNIQPYLLTVLRHCTKKNIWLEGILLLVYMYSVHVCIIHIDGLVQDCSNSIANALQLLQS